MNVSNVEVLSIDGGRFNEYLALTSRLRVFRQWSLTRTNVTIAATGTTTGVTYQVRGTGQNESITAGTGDGD